MRLTVTLATQGGDNHKVAVDRAWWASPSTLVLEGRTTGRQTAAVYLEDEWGALRRIIEAGA